jgi:rhodanese-related sulfurtransferase
LGSSARVSPKLPRDREIHLICRSGQRAYIATRMLQQNGFNAKTVSGGMLSLAHNYLLGQGDYG